jgi:hypothetical protein
MNSCSGIHALTSYDAGMGHGVGGRDTPPAHQLRLLRALGLVSGTRHGRSIVYRLYDNHVAMLLDEAVYHIEHLRLGVRDESAG